MSWQSTFSKLETLRGTKDIYVPWDLVKHDSALLHERAVQGLCHISGVVKERLPSDFRELLRRTIEENSPNLRCSSIRAIVEGRVPGVPTPLPATLLTKKKLDQVLALCDVLETLVHDYILDLQEESLMADECLSYDDAETFSETVEDDDAGQSCSDSIDLERTDPPHDRSDEPVHESPDVRPQGSNPKTRRQGGNSRSVQRKTRHD